MTFGKSTTCAGAPQAVQSVENVSGQKPAFITRSTMFPSEMAGASIAEIEPDARRRAASTRAGCGRFVDECCWARRVHVGSRCAGLSRSMSFGTRTWSAHVDLITAIEGSGTSCARSRLRVVGAGDIPGFAP